MGCAVKNWDRLRGPVTECGGNFEVGQFGGMSLVEMPPRIVLGCFFFHDFIE